jgi:pimeloyl-ACP methyl ester carboxylesterase
MQKRNIGFVVLLAAGIALIVSGVPDHHAEGSGLLAAQYDGSQQGSVRISFNNSVGNVTAGTQTFTATASGTLDAIEVFTSGFGSASKYPDANDCYLTLSDGATGAPIATSDNRYNGYGCGGDLRFSFRKTAPHLSAGSSYRWSYIFGSQNRSSITFFGTATDTIAGSFAGASLADAKFMAYASLRSPALLAQYEDDSNAPLAAQGVAGHSSVRFSATISSPSTDTLTLETELQPLFVPFTDVPNLHATSASVGEEPVTITMATSTLPNGAYHWQARTTDGEGNSSPWTEFQEEGTGADFFIEDPATNTFLEDDATSYTVRAEPAPCGGEGYFACALLPQNMTYTIPATFRIARASFDWQNDGSGNDCDGLGNYGAIIASSRDPAAIIATSTDTVYLGCARGTHGHAALSFSGQTIPAGNFSFTLGAFDGGLQGGSHITATHIALQGAPLGDESIETSSTEPAASSTPDASQGPSTSSTTNEDPSPHGHSSLVIIPGILGSYLMDPGDGSEVWPNVDAMLLSPSDAYLDALRLSAEGSSGDTTMIASDIIRTLHSTIPFAHKDVYGPLIAALEQEGWREGTDLFVAPYDWRLGVARAAQAVSPVIAKARDRSPDGKVTLLAHSMGGLVAKEFLATATDTEYINTVIRIGTPQLGAPQMFHALEFGDDLGFHEGPFPLLNAQEVKSIAQNMPSAYELLPSERYTAVQGGYVIDNRNGGHAILNFDGTNALMESSSTGEGTRNGNLLAAAASFHAAQDTAAIEGPAVYDLIGCQNPATPAEFILQDDGTTETVHGGGDGTVPTASAFNMAASSTKTYFSLYGENGADHEGLMNSPGPLALIKALLRNATSSLDLKALGISTSTEDCLEGRPSSPHPETTIEVDISGPVTMDATALKDSGDGAANGDIPGSRHGTTGGGAFLMLPAGKPYQLHIQGSRTGTFTMKLRAFDDAARPIGTITYIDVPLASASTTASLSIASSSEDAMLTLDAAGDGKEIYKEAPTAVLSAASGTDATPPVITLSPLPNDIRTDTSFTLSFSATDEDSGVATTSATLDGRSLPHDAVVNSLAEENHLLTLNAVDNAGNPRTASYPFSVHAASTPQRTDSQMPGAPIAPPSGGIVQVPGTSAAHAHHCVPRPSRS